MDAEKDGQPQKLEEPEREPTPRASDSDWEEWKRLPGRVGARAGHPAKPPEPQPAAVAELGRAEVVATVWDFLFISQDRPEPGSGPDNSISRQQRQPSQLPSS